MRSISEVKPFTTVIVRVMDPGKLDPGRWWVTVGTGTTFGVLELPKNDRVINGKLCGELNYN